MAVNCLLLLAVFLTTSTLCEASQPPTPAWPDQFTIKLLILVEQYGPEWNSTGSLYYDWTKQTFRADYIDWCLPLFGSTQSNPGSAKSNYYTCTFLATEGSMFFVNHTANSWEEDDCCLFEKGLGCIPPDWMSNCQYNNTARIDGLTCDVWWFPGTSDPDKPCYGYWDTTEKPHTPVQFFGLSSLGPTILQYSDFKPGPSPSNVSLSLPNRDSCFKECQPSLVRQVARSGATFSPHFPWPSCA